MNKRGITLVEIAISVGLISVVMLFLFRLLTDMQYERDHASFAKSNQQIRASIMKHVESDFINLKLVSVAKTSNTSITFTYQNSTSKVLTISDSSLTYADEETWQIVKDNDDTKIDIANIRIERNFPDVTCNDMSTSGNCSTYASYRVVIPVVTGREVNTIDDIEFFYIGRASEMS